MKKEINIGTTVALCLLSAATACNVTLLSTMSPRQMYGKLGEMQRIVDKNYVGEYDKQTMADMAASGLIVGMGDRWSAYLTKEQYDAYRLGFAGQLVGIGVSISYAEETEEILITDVYDDSPAAQAGLHVHDAIVGADGKTVARDGYAAVVDAVRGEENTVVKLTVRRADSNATQSLAIERKKVEKTAIRGRMLADNIGLIRIRDFDGGADVQFQAALKSLLEQGAEKLIFDVRFNPGGSVEVLKNMLDPLLPEGAIITLRPKEGEGTTYRSDAAALEMPMAVLVNEESISAAEFFPAALQEYGKAIIVGDKTIGKGYSQRQYELSDGSALLLSDQKYYTPKDKNLAGVGITPDISVSLSAESYENYSFLADAQDTQLQAAIAALAEK